VKAKIRGCSKTEIENRKRSDNEERTRLWTAASREKLQAARGKVSSSVTKGNYMLNWMNNGDRV